MDAGSSRGIEPDGQSIKLKSDLRIFLCLFLSPITKTLNIDFYM